MKLKGTVPVLRIFDEAKAKAHYVDFLGFKIDWEHRFEDNFPLYLQISRDGCLLHLTEHHGDACPGATVRIEVEGLVDFCSELRAKYYKYFKPGDPVKQPWGEISISPADPFGNKITFYETKPK